MCLDNPHGRSMLCICRAANSKRQLAREKQILRKSLPMKLVVLLDLDTNIDLQLLL